MKIKEWIKRANVALDYLRQRTLADGHRYKVVRNGNHTQLAIDFTPRPLPGGGGGTGAYPCKVTGSPTGGVYPVDVHKNGKTETKTGTGDLQVLQLHINETIPTNSWVMGFDTTIANYLDEE